MIKLEDFSWEDQLRLVRGCENFFVTYKSPKWQQGILRTLTKEFGKKYEVEIKVILTAASKAKRYNLTGSRITLNRNHYPKINLRTKVNVNLKRLKVLLTAMEEEGYLTLMVGYYQSRKVKLGSCIRFHNKLLDGLSKKSCNKWGMSRDTDTAYVEVIDEDKSTKSKKHYHSLKKFKGSGILVEEVKLINKVIESSEITYRGGVCYVRYKRRFEGNLQSGGRLYVIGTFQVENSEYRHTIEIDREPTIEADISCIHPSLLASNLGITLPKDYDPYEITYLLQDHIERSILRPLMKIAFMALLYAKHRGTALHEIREMLRENKGKLPTWLDEKTILEALEEHNVCLSPCFYKKEQWKFCQYLDSTIAMKVMLHFANKNIVALNYHDSWRVKAQYQEELVQVMEDSWLSVVGNIDNFNYKID